LWASSRAARGKITVSGILNCLIYYDIFMVCTQFTNVTVGRTIKPGGPRVGHHGLRHTGILDTVVHMYYCFSHKRGLGLNIIHFLHNNSIFIVRQMYDLITSIV
jgi:hypothetical protein